LEEDRAQPIFDTVQVRRQLVAAHVGDQEAHAAADVVADGLRDDEVLGFGDRADGDTAAAMEIGREHHGAQTSRRVAPEGADATVALGAVDGA
jgi:hypothetical protein